MDKNFRVSLIKFNLIYNSEGNIEFNIIESEKFETLDKKIVSCLMRNSDLLICLFVARNYKYKIMFINTSCKKEHELDIPNIQCPESSLTFFKFIHLKNDIC